MRKIAVFVMTGYPQALAAILGFALLSVLVPVVGLFAGGCVVLLTLKLDWRRAAAVIAGACAALAILSYVLHGFRGGMPAIVGASLLQWVPLLPLAMLLRRYRSPSWPLIAAAAAVAVAVVVASLLPGVEDWWRGVLLDYARLLNLGDDVTTALLAMVPFMSGVALSSLLLIWSLMLLLGRWWQSLLDAPGRFRDEFTSLRIGRGVAVSGIVAFGASMLVEAPLLRQLALVAMPLFLLQGVAVAHAWLAGLKRGRPWLAAFYALLVIAVVEPRLWLAVVALGWAESLFGLRRPPTRAGDEPEND